EHGGSDCAGRAGSGHSRHGRSSRANKLARRVTAWVPGLELSFKRRHSLPELIRPFGARPAALHLHVRADKPCRLNDEWALLEVHRPSLYCLFTFTCVLLYIIANRSHSYSQDYLAN